MSLETVLRTIKTVRSAYKGLHQGLMQEQKVSFRESAQGISSLADARSVKPGDMICVNDFLGIVVFVNDEKFLAIPALWKEIPRCYWYERSLILTPNYRRTDSSYMNSISHDIKTNAISFNDGELNQQAIESYIKSIEGDRTSRTTFPAFDYCIKENNGLYLPAIGELMLFQDTNLLKTIDSLIKKYHAGSIIPANGESIYWSSTDDINQEFKPLNDSYLSDSAAYAALIAQDGSLRKELISKKTPARILPFYKYKF